MKIAINPALIAFFRANATRRYTVAELVVYARLSERTVRRSLEGLEAQGRVSRELEIEYGRGVHMYRWIEEDE